MRYQPGHKVQVHRKILEDASRRVRAEGITGAAVSSVMRDAGLTHAVVKSPPETAWKSIVKAYLSAAHCEHAELGCPLAALASELARAGPSVKAPIRRDLIRYKNRMLPLMQGRRVFDKERAFFAIFSTMIGAIAIARILPDEAARARVLASTRDFLLRSF